MIEFTFNQTDQGLTFSLGVEVSSEALWRVLRGDKGPVPASGIPDEEIAEVRRILQQEAIAVLREGNERLQVRLLRAAMEQLEAERAERP